MTKQNAIIIINSVFFLLANVYTEHHERKLFYFAFSTAVVKSTVDPADGHSSAEAGLPLLPVPSSGQQWLLCS